MINIHKPFDVILVLAILCIHLMNIDIYIYTSVYESNRSEHICINNLIIIESLENDAHFQAIFGRSPTFLIDRSVY